jgi:hypothetical protein
MESYKYNIQDFLNIKFNGFDIELPKETLVLIQELTSQVGSPTYIKTPIFEKKENKFDKSKESKEYFLNDKKKKFNKNATNDEDWKSIRNVTKIEEKNTIDYQIDCIRSSLNKITNKNYDDLEKKIIQILDEMNSTEEEMMKIGKNIFDIASNNRFYSKLYADLYSTLIKKYSMMNTIFQNNLLSFLELFKHIEYISPEENYDKFCKINKENESRKALSAFILNLTINNIIPKEKLFEITVNLSNKILELIKLDSNKNNVDEITENIAILYNKDIFKTCEIKIDNLFISDFFKKMANSKTKDYLSLSNKTIFKFMDIIEM